MDHARLIDEMSTGYRNAMILAAATRTGIFAALGTGWATPHDVAGKVGLDPRATDVVIRALAAAGILRQDGDRFALEEGVRPFLLPDGAQTKTSIIGHNLTMMQSWIQLPLVLRTGRPAPRADRTEQEMRDFICGMENIARASSVEVAEKIDLGGMDWLLDLGGGPATAAITFARRYPRLNCVVFDLPGPLGIAREQIDGAGLATRITTAAGDFLTDPLPGPPGRGQGQGPGYDAVYVSNIIHSLGPDQTLAIFRKSRDVLAAGGVILVKDFFLEDSRTAPAMAAQFSVNMLVATEAGKSYTRSETLALLTAAGFGDFKTVGVAVHSQVIQARRES